MACIAKQAECAALAALSFADLAYDATMMVSLQQLMVFYRLRYLFPMHFYFIGEPFKVAFPFRFWAGRFCFD
jgi:hypothetical protein